jgi:hypothetical protein
VLCVICVWGPDAVSDSGTDKGIWCTNCHTQLSQELWKAENVHSLGHAQPGDPGRVRNPFAGATLDDIALGLGITTTHAEEWLDSMTTADMAAVWQPDPAFENPRTSACRVCHDDKWSEVSCSGGESNEWKRHLTEGRVAVNVWENVSVARTGSTCGW